MRITVVFSYCEGSEGRVGGELRLTGQQEPSPAVFSSALVFVVCLLVDSFML